jgi:D-alanine-D-alanine ligase
LRIPLFVKPADSGDSLGIDKRSIIHNQQELQQRCAELLVEFNKLLIEEYIDGREFTVLIASAEEGPIAFTPFEFVFDTAERFKTYRMKVTEHHVKNNIPVADPSLSQGLKDMAIQIYRAFDAESYARIDIRANQAGQIFFLEINCECSIFYPEGSEGSADYILKHEPIGHAGFLKLIIADGIRRHLKRLQSNQAQTQAQRNEQQSS